MPKIAEVKLLSCGLQKTLPLLHCLVAVAELYIKKKMQNCDFGSASFKLRKCDCGLTKKWRVLTSADNPVNRSVLSLPQNHRGNSRTLPRPTVPPTHPAPASEHPPPRGAKPKLFVLAPAATFKKFPLHLWCWLRLRLQHCGYLFSQL
jgi:hypothetical protein